MIHSKKYTSIIYVTSLLICLLSCEYEPDSKTYKELGKETHGEIIIELEEIQDSLVATYDTVIRYNIELNSDQRFYGTKVYIKDIEIYTSTMASGEFLIDVSEFAYGKYTLTVEVATSVGTETLADLIEAEALFYYRQLTVIINDPRPDPLEIVLFQKENGIAKVQWEKYDGDNFVRYEVKKKMDCNSRVAGEFVNLSTIDNHNTTSIIDETYFGGENVYRVDLTTSYFVIKGIPFSYHDTYPEIKGINYLSDRSVTLKWSKPENEEHFDYYSLRYLRSPHSYEGTIKREDEINDTSHTLEVNFGAAVNVTFTPNFNLGQYCFDYSNMTDTISLYAGVKIPEYQYFVHSTDTNYAYLVTDNGVMKYEVNKHKTIGNFTTTYSNSIINTNCAVSSDDNYLVYSTNERVYILNTDNLSVSSSFLLEDYFNGDPTPKEISVANNGWLCIKTARGAGIYDIPGKDTVIINHDHLASYDISAEGTYILYRNNRVNRLIMGSTFQTIGNIEGEKFIFPMDQEEFIYAIGSDYMAKYQCDNISKISPSSHISYPDDIFYDPQTQYFLLTSFNSNQARILDVDNKMTVSNEKVVLYSEQKQFAMFNNTLYSRNGYRLKLIE